ncbi:FtsX-like permease family protein [Mucilaginibacter rubeus]|uniref:ABC transporter permease n=1 Tax=Mucilaginibacter rubeus TaxID=2027860 RepID=A0AAE6JEH7_9SPHI|nr:MULTISPECIES: ABC transporter permease [Mucilaginibacter]QEM04138.1 FtsX-like permease family protein [Mucilaginibacter rubeus]QEM16740.1 FtsX-like permease family protein [Mucilaginibacter gossypii]QTE46782.1 ABC transporter permease [Mucilaginibacter rubeus]QTE53379.1 ABC transporter permease [Mucilaginibacter rubeus]QTE58465.1 ABC transporter permease [Mucilaginibacter rubeus]
MLRNYIKIAWRNLIKHKVFSFINIFGLAAGIAAFWLISLYVVDEWSYDRYNLKADRIFRVVQHGTWNGGKFNLAVTSPPYAPALKNDYAEVEDAIRIDAEGGGRITYGEKQINEGAMLFTDKGFFNLFTHHFLSGDPNTALTKPQSIVLTKTLAEKIFGNAADALDKTILIENNPSTVTGVIDDVPANSHFGFSALRSLPEGYTDGWANSHIYTYVLLKSHDDFKKVQAGSDVFFNRYLKGPLGAMQYSMELQPLTSIHLNSNLDYELGSNGNITYVYVFGIVALLILAIALINYVNLTTARSSIRIKEIGVRKVIGSSKKQLIIMFFAESVLFTVIAALIASVMVQFLLPYFNLLSGKSLVLMQFGFSKTLILFSLFAFVTGILSGLYPALFLAGFRTIAAMKGQMGSQAATIMFRKSLVVFQFVITIVMIAGSCIIYRQLHYVMNKDLGFNKAQTLTFHINDKSARAKIAAIKSQLLQNPAVEAVGIAGNPIGNNDIGSSNFNIGADGKANSESKMVENLIIDDDFIPTLQVKLAKGRNFSSEMSTDRLESIIVNQTLVDEMGWKDAIGRSVRVGVDDKGNVISRKIIGVVKDFNTYSLQHKVVPMMLYLPFTANDEDNMYIRIGKNNIPATLDYISKVYSRFDIENKVEFHFLDQNFGKQYQSEQKQGNILLIFTILAISIACLGLFGLVTFTAEQRVKEIGIRKVLGASVTSIVTLLSKDLMKLVLIATLIASPLAWYGMSKWLQSFAYRVDINWWIFAVAGILAVIIAFITVTVQSVRAANANPAKSLKSE